MLTKNDLINTGIIDPNSINVEANRIICNINTPTYCGGCHIYCFDDISYDGNKTHTATIMSKDLIEESIDNGNKTFVLFNQNNAYYESTRDKYSWLENYYIFLEFEGYFIQSKSFIFDCLNDFNHNELSNIIPLPESYPLKNRKSQKTPHKQENYKFVFVKKDTDILKNYLLRNRIEDEFTMNKKVLYETGIIAPKSVKEEEEYNRIVFKFDTYDNSKDNPKCHLYVFKNMKYTGSRGHVSDFKNPINASKIKEETIEDIDNGNRIYIIIPPNTTYYTRIKAQYSWLVDYFIFMEFYSYNTLSDSSFSFGDPALDNIKNLTNIISLKTNSDYKFVLVKKDPIVLRDYLLSADSRTYKIVIDHTPIFKSLGSDVMPKVEVTWPHNMLIHGAPGTGKSHMIDEKAYGKKNNNGEIENNEFSHSNINRVTFYEDYSYEKFVGGYMPVKKSKTTDIMFDNKTGKTTSDNDISYEFKPGVMAITLAKAYADLLKLYFDEAVKKIGNNKEIPKVDINAVYDYFKKNADKARYLLIIEEINRAPAASVFGDMFQLLDRDSDGLSTYSINTSEEFKKWFVDEIINLCIEKGADDAIVIRENAKLIASNLRLPPNLYIWATMNSADQGVFPLDTAFKRRWCYLYMSVEQNRQENKIIKMPDGKLIDWDIFRNAVNQLIIAAGCTEEDRLIGTWYFNDNDFDYIDKFYDEADPIKRNQMINPLCDKLFAYLRNDVFRNNPGAFFNKEYASMSAIRNALNNGVSLDTIIKNFKTEELVKESTSEKTTDNSDNLQDNTTPEATNTQGAAE